LPEGAPAPIRLIGRSQLEDRAPPGPSAESERPAPVSAPRTTSFHCRTSSRPAIKPVLARNPPEGPPQSSSNAVRHRSQIKLASSGVRRPSPVKLVIKQRRPVPVRPIGNRPQPRAPTAREARARARDSTGPRQPRINPSRAAQMRWIPIRVSAPNRQAMKPPLKAPRPKVRILLPAGRSLNRAFRQADNLPRKPARIRQEHIRRKTSIARRRSADSARWSTPASRSSSWERPRRADPRRERPRALLRVHPMRPVSPAVCRWGE
jgi:hypothetical protein